MKSGRKPVSAIIPLLNEEKTIEKLVKKVLKNSLISEVICVNDGSTDKSLEILKRFGEKIKLINLKKNYGKGYAMVQGTKKAKGEIVVFLDGDLTTLSNLHIEKLLLPIFKKRARVTLGFQKRSSLKYLHIEKLFEDLNLIGQRAYYKKDLLPYLKEMAKTRFGVEIYLNSKFKKGEVEKVHLKDLFGLYKHEKYGSKTAAKEMLIELKEIAFQMGKSKLNDSLVISRKDLNLNFIKKKINDKLLDKGYNPLFFWDLFSYFYKKIDLKSFYNFLFED